MILVPTPQLLDLIQNHINNLSSTNIESDIWLTTPRNALNHPQLESFGPNIIFIDEPESLLSPLSPRHLRGGAMGSHPFYKHPPPLATLLDQLARICARKGLETRMIWVGAELNGLLKRTVRQKGWAGMDALELDFDDAGQRALKDIGSLSGSRVNEVINDDSVIENGLKPDLGQVEHLAYAVGPTGVYPLFPGIKSDMPTYRIGRPIIDDDIIGAIVQYQAQNPTLEGTTTLLLPPEGYPLDLLATRLISFASTAQVPISITTTIPSSIEADVEKNSIILTSRSAVPGLDIPKLSRIILINGLDLAGLSPAQRSRGGAKKRAAFYDVVAGRLGRLGSVMYQNNWKGQVISFVTEGSGEEVGLETVKMTQRGGIGSRTEGSSGNSED
jgi:hypothetical protein